MQNVHFLIDEEDGWSGSDAWSWKTDFEETTPSSKPSDNWLQHCIISCTPQSETMVIAYQDRYVVLARKYKTKCINETGSQAGNFSI